MGAVLRVTQKPFAVFNREPRPSGNGSGTECGADPEVDAAVGTRFGNAGELRPVREHEARENDGERRQNIAPGHRPTFFGVAAVRHNGDEDRNDGHEHACERRTREANAHREQTIENEIADQRQLESIENFAAGELFKVFAKNPKEGKGNDAESDKASEGNQNGIVLREQKRRDVNQTPKSAGSYAEKHTCEHG